MSIDTFTLHLDIQSNLMAIFNYRTSQNYQKII